VTGAEKSSTFSSTADLTSRKMGSWAKPSTRTDIIENLVSGVGAAAYARVYNRALSAPQIATIPRT
jgi:hypothetical protein